MSENDVESPKAASQVERLVRPDYVESIVDEQNRLNSALVLQVRAMSAVIVKLAWKIHDLCDKTGIEKEWHQGLPMYVTFSAADPQKAVVDQETVDATAYRSDPWPRAMQLGILRSEIL